ncbi:MAG: hypothetical protein NC043_06980 [Muribaculaceae bacterium]|nr:hypothetical protein [Muribaculaceae bacterium]
MKQPQTLGRLLHDTNVTPPLPAASTASCRALEVRRRYGCAEKFLSTFNPDHQARYCRHTERVFLGSAPPLVRVAAAYGQGAAESFIMIQLHDLSEYAGCSVKLSAREEEEAARLILHEWGHLKVTELMYFFFLYKTGRFGEFYGAVDRLKVMKGLREFMGIRGAELDRLCRVRARQQKQEEEARSSRNVMDYAEYVELHWLFNMGYEPAHIHAAQPGSRPCCP